MEKISYRELQRLPSDKLQELLPCGITLDSQGIAIILSVEGYKVLLDKHRQNDSQAKLYNPSIHKAGDRVLIRQGKKLVETVIPELDADGYPIHDV